MYSGSHSIDLEGQWIRHPAKEESCKYTTLWEPIDGSVNKGRSETMHINMMKPGTGLHHINGLRTAMTWKGYTSKPNKLNIDLPKLCLIPLLFKFVFHLSHQFHCTSSYFCRFSVRSFVLYWFSFQALLGGRFRGGTQGACTSPILIW